MSVNFNLYFHSTVQLSIIQLIFRPICGQLLTEVGQEDKQSLIVSPPANKLNALIPVECNTNSHRPTCNKWTSSNFPFSLAS